MEQPKQHKSLFEKYGGKPTVEKLVDYFYDELVLKDPSVNGFFTKTDFHEQKKKQAMFITVALGGAPKYTGKTMKASHQGRHIHLEHFNTIVNHLVTTLRVHSVEEADIQAVKAKLGTYQNDIVEQHEHKECQHA